MQYNVKWKKGTTGGVCSVNASSKSEAISIAIQKVGKFGNRITESDVVDVTTGVYSNGNMTMWS